MWISHRKEIRISLRWLINIINSADKTKLPFRYTSIYFLNPDYVAARSLRSLRSNNIESFEFLKGASPNTRQIQCVK